MTRLSISAATVIAVLLVSIQSYALSICGTLRYWDDRDDRSSANGSKLGPGTENTDRPARRVLVHLYEEDGDCNDFDVGCNDTDNDDWTASVYTNASDGTFCFNNLPADSSDWYFLTNYQSDDFEIKSSSGSAIVATSRTAYNLTTSVTKNWNITCVDDAANADAGECDSDTEANNDFGLFIPYGNLLDTAVDVDWLVSPDSLFHLNGHSGRIVGYYPDTPDGDCVGYLGRAVPNSCNDFCISSGVWDENHIVVHEIGHVLHKRALNICGTLTDGTCGSYGWDSSGSEKCATAEGWASFVAAATYWESDSTGPPLYRPSVDTTRRLEDETTRGNASWEYCVSNSSSPETAPGNVSRFFWDAFDSTAIDEGGTDNSSLTFGTLLSVWDEFGAGTGNWANNESGSTGVNIWDYYHYETGLYSEVYTNCLGAQDLN